MKNEIIVIGGGPAGIISAITAKKYYSDKNVLLIKDVEKGVIPCGIPYMFSTLKNSDDNAMGNKSLELNKVNFVVDKVLSIDKENKSVQTKNSGVLEFEKLIIATGSKPFVPRIDGIEKKGVYSIIKEMNHLKNLESDIKKATEIVIIGGGFIGVEFADELSRFKDKKITVVEFLPEILMNSFDKEFSDLAKGVLIKQGINLETDKKVTKVNGDERVRSLSLSDGSEIPCQVVILGVGALPNSDIANSAKLDIGKSKGILVDEYMRTSDKDIFAVGDCAEKKDFFTRKKISIMLASTACAEARIAGSNLYNIKLVRDNVGTIATYSTKIGGLTLGSAGLTEQSALKEGFEIVVGKSNGVDKHPALLPNACKTMVKLIFSKQSGVILGGQVSGGDSAGELINVVGLAIQKKINVNELEILQIATHPKLTAAPTTYPLIVAAQDALSKLID